MQPLPFAVLILTAVASEVRLDGTLPGLMFGDIGIDTLPVPADFQNVQRELEHDAREFQREERKMEHAMAKMEKKGIKSFSDSKETIKNNGNLHEQETKCIDGKCREKVMDGKEFDPQAEARKEAAIAAKKKDLEMATVAEHKAEQAAKEAAAAQTKVEKAAIEEKKAERDAARSAQDPFPGFPNSDFQDSSIPFLAQTPSSVMQRHASTLIIGCIAGSALAAFTMRRRKSAIEEALLLA